MTLNIDEPIRVLHVFTPAFGFGFSGQTFVLQELFKRWKHQRISLNWYGTGYRFLANTDGSKKNAAFTNSIKSSRLSRIVYNIKLWANLIIKKNEYDIIQVHNLGWGGLFAPMVVHWIGKKAVYLMSLMGSDNPSTLLSEKWGKFKLWLFMKYDGILGLSPALIEDCQKYGISSRKLLMLPNFISFDPFLLVDDSQKANLRKILQIPESDKVLLFVGSIIERKGIDILISAFIRLADEDKNIWLVLIGPQTKQENIRIDEEFVKSQAEILRRAGCTDRVIWVGMLNERQLLAEYYRMSDVFVFPSRAEGQGNVILEAMAAGLPIVSTHLVGVTDMMVAQDQQGLLFAKDDLDGFIRAVKRLLEDDELRLKMGHLGRMKVLNEFTFDTYARKLSNFYLSIIDTL